jgi:DNA-binding IclR family transcriptional regulator
VNVLLIAEDAGLDSAQPNAAQKVCAVLRALAAHSPAALRDLSRAAGLNKVTTFRILGTLAGEGFVRRPRGTQLYDLGPEVAVLATALAGRVNLRAAAQPALLRLASVSGDTAVLSIRAGSEAICLDRQTGAFPIQSNYLHPGTRRPLGVGAGALALLAALPLAEGDAMLELMQDRPAPFPRLHPPAVREGLARARARGYALVVDQIVERMGGIAVAVRGPGGEALGALSIIALSERITAREAELAALLADAARATEAALAAF